MKSGQNHGNRSAERTCRLLLIAGLAVVSQSLWPTVPTASAMQDTQTLIKQALDEPTKITLAKTTVVAAMEEITRQTGVRLVMDQESVGLLPYGKDTVVEHVAISGVSLRDGLKRLFGPLGMRFVVRTDHVAIVPHDALRCLARPPTWVELDTMADLAAQSPGVDPDALDALKERVQFRLSTPNAWNLLAGAVRNVGAGPGDEVLSAACTNLGWAWCPAEDKILILPATRLVHRKLSRSISVRLNQRPLMAVMTAVGDAVGVNVRVEPGTLAKLPPHVRDNFSIDAHGHSAEQALDTIAGYTGLGYLIEPEGVVFYLPTDGGRMVAEQATAAAVAAPSGRDPYVAKIVVEVEPGRTIEWLIRKSELPADLQEMRQQEIEDVIKALRKKVLEGQD